MKPQFFEQEMFYKLYSKLKLEYGGTTGLNIFTKLSDFTIIKRMIKESFQDELER